MSENTQYQKSPRKSPKKSPRKSTDSVEEGAVGGDYLSSEFSEKLQIESEESFQYEDEVELQPYDIEERCNFQEITITPVKSEESRSAQIVDSRNLGELKKFLTLYGEMPMINPFLNDSFHLEVTQAMLIPDDVYKGADLTRPGNVYKYVILKVNMVLKYLSEAPGNYKFALDSLIEPGVKLEEFLRMRLDLDEFASHKIATARAVYELCRIVVYLCSGFVKVEYVDYEKLKNVLLLAYRESNYMVVVSLLISLSRVFKNLSCIRIQQIILAIITEMIKIPRTIKPKEMLDQKINKCMTERDGLLMLELTILDLKLVLLEEIFVLSAITFERNENQFENSEFDENIGDILMDTVINFEDQDDFLSVPSKILNFQQAEKLSAVIKRVGHRLEMGTRENAVQKINAWMGEMTKKGDTIPELSLIQRRNMYYDGMVYVKSAKFNLDPRTRYKLAKKSIEKWNDMAKTINMNQQTDVYGKTIIGMEEAYKVVWMYAYELYEAKGDDASYKKMKSLAIQRLNHGNKFLDLVKRSHFYTQITWGSLYDMSMCYVKALRDTAKGKLFATQLATLLQSNIELFQKFVKATGLNLKDHKMNKHRLVDFIVKSFYDKETKGAKEAQK